MRSIGESLGFTTQEECDRYNQMVTDLIMSDDKGEQKPAAWSEEDRRKLSRIYSVLRQAADTHAFSTTCRLIGDKECIELQDFLRSIIQQPRQEFNEGWKPSEEQMQTLLQCEAVLKVGGRAELGDKIGEIYEQLKNLTE